MWFVVSNTLISPRPAKALRSAVVTPAAFAEPPGVTAGTNMCAIVDGQQTPFVFVSVQSVVVYVPIVEIVPTCVNAACADKGAKPFAFFFFKYS
jgi:hypothetical protein